MSEYIPLEMQAEILKRLPLKPLIRCRSVSKGFKCLIESPAFIALYGVGHPQPDQFILRYTIPSYLDHAGENKYLTLIHNDDHTFFKLDFVPYLVMIREPHLKVVGSSHGLVCFNAYYEYPNGNSDNRDIRNMVLLWNLSIMKYVGIQVPYSPNENFENIGHNKVIGFGVYPVTFDPTILKIKCADYKWKMEDSVPWEVEVFTLSTGTWSILSGNLPRESIKLGGSQVVDRFIYWVAFDMLAAEDGRHHSNAMIVSFDLTTKEFKEINFRDSLTKRLSRIPTISKLHESLVLVTYDRMFEEDDVPVCCLWMMKEQESFTKLYTINLPDDSCLNTLLGFRKTGELILETRHQNEQNSELQIYEPNSKSYENLWIDGEYYSYFMCSYMETLILVDHRNGFMYFNTHEGETVCP